MLNRLAEPVRPGHFAEQVAGDEQHVGVFRAAVGADALDGGAEVEGAVDPPEAVAEVPVGRVEDAHNFLHHGGLRPPGQRRLGAPGAAGYKGGWLTAARPAGRTTLPSS